VAGFVRNRPEYAIVVISSKKELILKSKFFAPAISISQKAILVVQAINAKI
jgi:hypothetical protein